MKNLVNKKRFDCFTVFISKEGNCFVYFDESNKDVFIDGVIEYIFKESNLLNFAQRKNKIIFNASARQYCTLYRNISYFLNRELEEFNLLNLNSHIKNIIKQEYLVSNDNGTDFVVQNDKIGKIGEYIFHLLLTDYYQIDCILPKFTCMTDRNMSVFGIDTLFLDKKEKTLYFGESKFCKNIDNGIDLINQSLEDYDSQISEEYRLVLNSDSVNLSKSFMKLFGNERELSISFSEFIKRASIKKIAIPIFIAHGDECKGESWVRPFVYLEKMERKIKKRDIFGLDVKYIFISLPVIDKDIFIKKAIVKVLEKQNEYKNKHI